MNVIKKFYNNLPKFWKDYIRNNNLFDLQDFSKTIFINFEDGSTCVFVNCYLIQSVERKEFGVFTEHSGYYIFYMDGGINYKVYDDNNQEIVKPIIPVLRIET